MHRFLTTPILALVALGLLRPHALEGSEPVASGTPPASKQPNLVFILVDDLGWGDLACLGQTHWQTPELDRMAREGVLFTQAYAGSTVCAPSRAALLTGQHTGRTWMRGNGNVTLRDDPLDLTIATRLRDLGYATAMIGKSSVACNSDDPEIPHRKGFDHFFGLLSHTAAHRQYPRSLHRNGEVVALPGNHGKLGDTYASELFVDDALDWMGSQGDTPFFLLLSLTPPHADLAVPEHYMTPFRGRFVETANTKGGYYHQQECRAAYAGMVAFLDESVGRVLDRIDDLGLRDRTVVFFASDNGPHHEGGADPDFFDSNGPFRGGKRDLTEGGLRTPQIVWGPGIVEGGRRLDLPTAFWDFPPTALELAGALVDPDSSGMDGLSIAPALRGLPGQQTHPYLYWEFHEQGGKQAVRMGSWKGIRTQVQRDPRGPIALYNIDADPGESRDVAEQHPDVVRAVADIMDRARTPSPLFRFGAPAQAKP